MNDVAMMDKNLSVDRTPQLIAIEINSIKEQTRKQVLFNSIEIGKRLAEAKIMLGHGEWGDWLKGSVDYSQRTASNLMGIFEQYGTSQINMFCENNAKSQALANLSYTQAVLLMGIPQEDRESFIQEQDIDSMSTRELQAAIREKQELEAKLSAAEDGWEGAKKATDKAEWIAKKKSEEVQKLLDEKQKTESDFRITESILRNAEAVVEKLQNDLQKEKDESTKEIIRLGQSIADMNKSLSEAQASGNDDEVEHLSKLLVETDGELHTAYKKIEDLESQLKEPINITAVEVVEKVPEEIERELNELRERTKELETRVSQSAANATKRFKLHFDTLVKGFGDLLGVLAEIDVDTREKYKNAVKGLIEKMSEKL